MFPPLFREVFCWFIWRTAVRGWVTQICNYFCKESAFVCPSGTFLDESIAHNPYPGFSVFVNCLFVCLFKCVLPSSEKFLLVLLKNCCQRISCSFTHRHHNHLHRAQIYNHYIYFCTGRMCLNYSTAHIFAWAVQCTVCIPLVNVKDISMSPALCICCHTLLHLRHFHFVMSNCQQVPTFGHLQVKWTTECSAANISATAHLKHTKFARRTYCVSFKVFWSPAGEELFSDQKP